MLEINVVWDHRHVEGGLDVVVRSCEYIYSLQHRIGQEKKVDGKVCVLNIAGSGKTCGVGIAMAPK